MGIGWRACVCVLVGVCSWTRCALGSRVDTKPCRATGTPRVRTVIREKVHITYACANCLKVVVLLIIHYHDGLFRKEKGDF